VGILGHLEIVGVDMKDQMSLNEPLKITLTFKVLRPLNWYWKPEFSFIDRDGKKSPLALRSVIDNEVPMYTWAPGLYFKVEFSGHIPAPGPYHAVAPGAGKISLGSNSTR